MLTWAAAARATGLLPARVLGFQLGVAFIPIAAIDGFTIFRATLGETPAAELHEALAGKARRILGAATEKQAEDAQLKPKHTAHGPKHSLEKQHGRT